MKMSSPSAPAGRSWTDPCDLCGSFRLEPVRNSSVRKCGECGLIQASGDTRPPTRSLPEPLESALRYCSRHLDQGESLEVLVIGPIDDDQLAPLRSRCRVEVTYLHFDREQVDRSETNGRVVPTFQQASFLPEQFQLIIIGYQLGSFAPPSSVLSKLRVWLAPGGLIVSTGINWGSVERRILPSRWIDANGAIDCCLTPAHVKEYAARHGYVVVTTGTRSSISYADLLLPEPRPLTRLALLPVSIVGNVAGLGYAWWAILAKRGFVRSPALKKLEERHEQTAGLAGATSTRVQTEFRRSKR